MPTLHWIGKDKVINHHMDVPYKVLEHTYGFDNGKQNDQETKSGNKIIHGDNLEALSRFYPNTKEKSTAFILIHPTTQGMKAEYITTM
jgi:adenine-specific DNA-methyltransferase